MNRKPLITLSKAQQLWGVDKTTFERPRYVMFDYCEWCGEKIENKRRTSCCSKECSQNFNISTSTVYYANIHSRGGYANHIMRRDNYTCQVCGEFHGKINKYNIMLPTTDGQLEIHHIKHVQDGGGDEPENLFTVCKQCHKNIHNGVGEK